MRVFIGLGSNLGDRQKNIDKALCLMEESGDVKVVRCSSFIETEPVGGVATERFLNGACEVSTDLECEHLLSLLMSIENKIGRNRSIGLRWANRVVDVDILFYGDRIMQDEKLTVPHPEIQNRWFVLKPLSEIAPDFIHPVLKTTISELLLCNELY